LRPVAREHRLYFQKGSRVEAEGSLPGLPWDEGRLPRGERRRGSYRIERDRLIFEWVDGRKSSAAFYLDPESAGEQRIFFVDGLFLVTRS